MGRKLSYIKGLKEWQEHQYTPGYYTKGRIPHFIFNKRPNKLGLGILILGVIHLLVFGVTIIPLFFSNYEFLAASIYLFFLGAFQVFIGIKVLQKPRKKV
jgi:hypothetical protein